MHVTTTDRNGFFRASEIDPFLVPRVLMTPSASTPWMPYTINLPSLITMERDASMRGEQNLQDDTTATHAGTQ